MAAAAPAADRAACNRTKETIYAQTSCNSFRTNGEPQGSCNRKGAAELLQYLQAEISDCGLDAIVSTTSCLNVCEKGPILVIYPKEWWYYGVTEEKIDQILDALEQDQPVDSLMMA